VMTHLLDELIPTFDALAIFSSSLATHRVLFSCITLTFSVTSLLQT